MQEENFEQDNNGHLGTSQLLKAAIIFLAAVLAMQTIVIKWTWIVSFFN